MIVREDFGNVSQYRMARVLDGNALYTMAVYWVDGLLIDTGPFHVSSEIPAAFNEIKIAKIVNTHHHEDHIGNNIVFQNQNIPIFAHRLAVPLIKNPSAWNDRLYDYQRLVWGEPPASNVQETENCINTSNRSFRVIHTPGHALDHICLLEEDKGWLFSGDLFLSEKVKMLRKDENVRQLMDSIRKLLTFDFEMIFCSSGSVFNNGHTRMEQKLNYWQELHEQSTRLFQEGWKATEIRDALLGPETIMAELTGGDFSKLNLIQSFLDL
jgi:glyoxylase-like metal-dependent hydrolase (beta-lactamase superfamily II)